MTILIVFKMGATVNGVVLKLQKKKDATWNVKIRVTLNRKHSYLDTDHYICVKQLTNKFRIKDQFILDALYPKLRDYRKLIGELGERINSYNAQALANYLENGGLITAEQINVISFGTSQIEKLRFLKRTGSAGNMLSVVNHLVDFIDGDTFLAITEIRAKMLYRYEEFLKTPRFMLRNNQKGKPILSEFVGLAPNGLHNHFRDLKILFNNILEFYNDEDEGIKIIHHNPFKKYKLVDLAPTSKPTRTVEQLKKIMNVKVRLGTRLKQAKDLFILSYYLCGINAVDLHQIDAQEVFEARLDYNRSKTKRRKDKAFISVKIPKVGIRLYKKYAGTLNVKYGIHNALDQALSVGMRELGLICDIPDLEFTDARRMVASFGYNICRHTLDEIGMTLNHKNAAHAVTEIYITKDWSIIDRVQASIIELVARKSKKFDRWKMLVNVKMQRKSVA